MRVVLQVAKEASVSVDNKVVGNIDYGYLLLVGFTNGDTEEKCKKLALKIKKLRVFEDENEKMNLNIDDVNGKILSVSQFTLYANTDNGNRPSFTDALKPDEANKLYEVFNNELRSLGLNVETGIFGAMMDVKFTNYGPTTIIYEL